MLSQSGLEKFEFLRKLALDMGAVDARVIPADKIVVEDRIVLKCKVGCVNYGKTLMCPIHADTYGVPKNRQRIQLRPAHKIQVTSGS